MSESLVFGQTGPIACPETYPAGKDKSTVYTLSARAQAGPELLLVPLGLSAESHKLPCMYESCTSQAFSTSSFLPCLHLHATRHHRLTFY